MSSNKKTKIITSVVVGVFSSLFIALYKRGLSKNFLTKLSNLKSLTSDGIKDFLEVQNLNLRIKVNKKQIDEKDVVKLYWDSDSSDHYFVFLSKEKITKSIVINLDKIPFLEDNEIHELLKKQNWIRKIKVNNSLSFTVPFNKFHSRLRSARGRISNSISYPSIKRKYIDKEQIVCWIIKRHDEYMVCIRETNDKNNTKILFYEIILYMDDGMGVRRKVPPFKDFIRINLGPLNPCLCYIQASRSIGISLEKFVGWIGEEEALTLKDEDFI